MDGSTMAAAARLELDEFGVPRDAVRSRAGAPRRGAWRKTDETAPRPAI